MYFSVLYFILITSLKAAISGLKHHINRIVNRFILEKTSPTQTTLNLTTVNIARVALPFKDQKVADTVRRQLNDLGSKINVSFQPVFLSKKLEDELKDVRANCFCASLLRTQIHMPRHATSCIERAR